MAVGLIAAEANDILDALVAAYPYLQLHDGDPGASGTSNVATESTRELASWAAASGGGVTTDTDTEWLAVAGTEDYTHVSGWSASSGGSCGYTGTITASAVTAGDDFALPAGDVDVSLNVAA